MPGYFGPIGEQTLKNTYFRQVLFTGRHAQLVVMSLEPGEEIGNEVHPDVDQFFMVESGMVKFALENGRETYIANEGDAVVIPAGMWHNVVNASNGGSKLFTLYSPPQHPDGTIHKTKAEAQRAEGMQEAA